MTEAEAVEHCKKLQENASRRMLPRQELELFLAVLDRFPGSAAVQRAGLNAFSSLTKFVKANCDVVGKLDGGLLRVMTAMDNHANAFELQYSACLAMFQVLYGASTNVRQAAIVDGGPAKRLLRAKALHPPRKDSTMSSFVSTAADDALALLGVRAVCLYVMGSSRHYHVCCVSLCADLPRARST